MDFKYIVETKEEYSEDKLNDQHKEFVAGMRYVLENDVENFVANHFIETDKEQLPVLERMQFEIVEEAVEELKEYIESSIYEAIVCLHDEEYSEEVNAE